VKLIAEQLMVMKQKCQRYKNNCPSDKKQGTDVVCRASGGDCDETEYCDGENNNCPSDSKKGSVVCRVSRVSVM